MFGFATAALDIDGEAPRGEVLKQDKIPPVIVAAPQPEDSVVQLIFEPINHGGEERAQFAPDLSVACEPQIR
jgi:hypothetical protein